MLTNTKIITVSKLAADSYPNYTGESKKYYRVKKSFKGRESKGSFYTWELAYNEWLRNKGKGYHIYDDNGKQLD